VARLTKVPGIGRKPPTHVLELREKLEELRPPRLRRRR